MKLCVLIPFWYKGKNTEWLTEQCLDHLAEVEPGLMDHVCILDDASPNSEQYLKDMSKRRGIFWHRKDYNTSYSANVNTGLKLAESLGYNFALTMNNDVFMKTPFVERAEERFNDPHLNVLGCRLYYPNGIIQHQSFSIKPDRTINPHGAGQFDTAGLHPSEYVFGVTGAFQIIRLKPLFLYDESYPLAYEDVEYCARQWLSCYRVFYDRDIVGIHCESATRGKDIGAKELASMKVFRRDLDKWNLNYIYERIHEANHT